MDAYGYDFSSEAVVPSQVADDFLCVDGEPVIDLHWWGSYWDSGTVWPYHTSGGFPDPTTPTDTPPGTLLGFDVAFYADVPAGTDPLMPWSHPGIRLYQTFIDMANVTEVLFGTVAHVGGVEENVWQYNADLPTPFLQEAGNIYWLRIQAVFTDPAYQWGWHEADSLWHDNAVQTGYGREGMWEILTNKDMAFELSVPEPATLSLVAIGALALIRRSRLAGR
jgi:hypothetical protein